ncbi:recombination regulator RecX [Aciduricibacillus chroicocephali]|uniref:Regulatory protein RecX n=1 Tax=Aciduricibacillus chroicocephali TaxID=3054939 RepID=A0ABY9KXG5_9BACI|nr:recombination regulator RecX [Bacillaceae bacterium 44XB]
MKKIARITTQKRNKERYNIYISDGEREFYAFSVDEAILIQYALRKGMELEDEFLDELLRQNSIYEAYTRAIHFLSYRMRTKKEIKDHLFKKEIEPEQIEQVMERLERDKLIDDAEFANMFVRTRVNTSDKGPGHVRRELLEKGVAPQIAEEALKFYSFEDEREKAVKFAQKKVRQPKQESSLQLKQRIQASLMQKGFSQGAIKEALNELSDIRDENDEQAALSRQGEKLLRKHGRAYEGYELRQKVTEALYRKGFSFDSIRAYLDEHMK